MDIDDELDALDMEMDCLAKAMAWAMAGADTEEKTLAAAKRFLPRLRELRDRKAALLKWGGEEEA